MTRGPEERNIIGNITEEQAQIFFEKFCKWKLILKNEDFSNTKFGTDKSGFDQLYEVNDPILNKKIYVLVESKFREDNKTLHSNILYDFIYGLKKKILKGQNPVSWKDTVNEKINNLRYGVLFLRFQNFSQEKIMKTMGSIAISKTKRETIPPAIFTLFNYRLAKFAEFANENKKIKYIYPAGVGQKSFETKSEVLSIFYLFSDLIPGEFTDKANKKQNFLISFEEPNADSLKYLCIYISRVLKLKSAKNCTVYFSEGNFNKITDYKSKYLDKEYGDLGIGILNGMNLDCNFDFARQFK